ncbi:MAG: arylsulfotransferase family protein, partial [Eubacteriales bacterium]
MKKFYEKYKILVCAVVLVCCMLGSAMVGLQYFQEEFLALKIAVKDMIYGSEVVVAEVTTEVGTTEEEEIVSDWRSLTINGQDAYIDVTAADMSWHNVCTMTTDFSNTFVFNEFADFDIWIDGEQVEADGEAEVTLEKLATYIGIPLKLVNKETGEELNYYIRTLNSGYNVGVADISENVEEGYYYFTQGDTIYKMDTNGDIVYYLGTTGDAHDFKAYMIDGEVYYTYLQAATECSDEHMTGVGYYRCRAVVMNANYEIIDEMIYMVETDGVPANHSLENHEFNMLDLGHYMTTSYVATNVDNIPTDVDDDGCAYVVACVAQEIIDGELVFEWNSTDHPELYAYSVENCDYDSEDVQDYIHINSLDIDPADDNVVMSFRNIDAILKVDRETSEIIWVLGGLGDQFGLTTEQLFARQHFAKYYDGVLTFYDNGNDKEQTRVVEIILDEENMTVVDYQYHQIDGKYTWYMGSSQCLDYSTSRYLMGWGGNQFI